MARHLCSATTIWRLISRYCVLARLQSGVSPDYLPLKYILMCVVLHRGSRSRWIPRIQKLKDNSSFNFASPFLHWLYRSSNKLYATDSTKDPKMAATKCHPSWMHMCLGGKLAGTVWPGVRMRYLTIPTPAGYAVCSNCVGTDWGTIPGRKGRQWWCYMRQKIQARIHWCSSQWRDRYVSCGAGSRKYCTSSQRLTVMWTGVLDGPPGEWVGEVIDRVALHPSTIVQAPPPPPGQWIGKEHPRETTPSGDFFYIKFVLSFLLCFDRY